VFANGDVTARTTIMSNVIVCDGDVTLTEGHLNRSVIVARGNITAKSAGNSALMAGGKVEVENKNAPKGQNLIVESKPNTLGITFFELSTVGVEVKVADKAVQVGAVANGKPFAKAGVKVGDIILDVNGKKPTDAESLRRLLRDALAVGDATVKLKRGDKTETFKVSLPE
jgi:membrane-associated protease RseP (regulator of RpoE activity)